MVWSALAEYSHRPSAEKINLEIQAVCPSNFPRSLPVTASQSRIVPPM
jgi:hypothetical protein